MKRRDGFSSFISQLIQELNDDVHKEKICYVNLNQTNHLNKPKVIPRKYTNQIAGKHAKTNRTFEFGENTDVASRWHAP